MDKDTLNKRLEQLEAHKVQILANYNLVQGSIEECKYWLTQSEKDLSIE